MKTIVQNYTLGFKKQQHRFGVWKPGAHIRLGDVGTFDGAEFFRKGNLSDKRFGITFRTITGPRTAKEQFSSEGAARTEINAGTTLPDAGKLKGKIKLSFASSNAFHVETIGNVISAIDNIFAIETQIKNLQTKKRWENNLVIITEIETVERAHLVIATTKESEIEFEATGDVNVASVNLAEANTGLQITRNKNIQNIREFTEPIVLTFNAVKLKGLFRSSLQPMGILSYKSKNLDIGLKEKIEYSLAEISPADLNLENF